MKKSIILVTTIFLLVLSVGFGRPQSGYDLFQQALVKERAEGNINEAIKLLQRIVRENANDRTLAAKALIELGQCYEKLGKTEARKTYERVLRDYADQSAEASEARTRLAALSGGGKTTEMVSRRVWSGPEVDPEGAPSSDGRYLTYVDWDTGDLAIHDLATGEKRRLTHKGSWAENDEYAEYSVPSPDGKQVAYSWFKGDRYVLRVIDIDGSHLRTLYRNKSVGYFYVEPRAWTPDGKQILAALVRKDFSGQIAAVSAADGSVRILKDLQPGGTRSGNLAPMCISPDGRYVAYSPTQKGNQDRHDIFLIPMDGSQELPIVTHPSNNYFLGWAPDGKTLVFASDRTGAVSAWAIEVIDGKPQGSAKLLKPDVGRIRPLGSTRNGSCYYALSDTVRDLYTASLDLATGKLLTPPAPVTLVATGLNFAPAWSDDGKYLAYLSLRHRPRGHGPATIVIRSLETGEEREVVPKLEDMRGNGGLGWSQDGRSLLVRGKDEDGRQGIFQINAQTAEASLLLEIDADSGTIFFRLTQDGKSLIYSKLTPEGLQFFIRDLRSGESRELTRPQEVQRLALSPDGSEIAFDTEAHHDEAPAIKVVPVAGGEPRSLYSLKRPADFAFNMLAWTHNGNRIVLGMVPTGTASPGQKTELWEISAEGGAPQKLGLNGEDIRHLCIHPDGQRIAYEAGAISSEVDVLENLLPALKAAK